MEGIDLSGGSIARTYMLRGVIAGGRFVRADLSGSDLTGAAAEEADFSDANLSGARLAGASFDAAVFRSANLQDADFTNARIEGAVFDGAQNMPLSLLELVSRKFGFK